MPDLLYDAATYYQKMLKVSYNIVLGHKNKTYSLNVKFYKDNFHHLIGLQHLTDLPSVQKNRERVFREILSGKVTYKDIEKSRYFDQYGIAERIECISHLEDLLDANDKVFLIRKHEYEKYTSIKADVLFEHERITNDILYYFLKNSNNPKDENEYVGCSLFKKNQTDYRTGTAKAALLYNEKIIQRNDDVVKSVLFQHKGFIPSN